MDARSMAAAIRVVNQPLIPGDVALEHEDMPAPCRHHVRSWCCTREPQPVGGKVQCRDDPAKHIQRCAAAAKGVRTAARTPAQNNCAGPRYFPPRPLGQGQRCNIATLPSAARWRAFLPVEVPNLGMAANDAPRAAAEPCVGLMYRSPENLSAW
jgi:hypothetical protein